MKAVANLDEDFAGVDVVRATESEAVVEKHAAIGDVDGLQICRKPFAELFADR